jgi:hypothetical protein
MHTRPSAVGANSLPPDHGHHSRQRCPWPSIRCWAIVIACVFGIALSFLGRGAFAEDAPLPHQGAWPINNWHNHQPTQDQLSASSDGVIRLVTPVLALMRGMMAIGFVASDRLPPSANLLSTVTQWMGSQLSTAGADSRVLGRDGASRANDDGYLEGLQKALGL